MGSQHSKPDAHSGSHQPVADVIVAVMGATGTGKSTFIKHLTNDAKIHIGHNPESETSEVQTAHYTDTKTGRSVMLIDTPGFDDSRDGLTDTDILQKIIDFLQPEKGEGKKLNGIIYMHRISDPRVGGLSRQNLRMFQALCGDKSLHNVRVVTTNWNRVAKKEGRKREELMKQDAFQPLLASGAQMRRQSNNIRSARAIMAKLIPLEAVSTQLQDQVADGKKLGETDAGLIIKTDIEELQKQHTKELAGLERQMEEAAQKRDEELRAELAADKKVLKEKVRRAEEDKARLDMTIGTLRNEQKTGQEELKRWKAWADNEAVKLQQARTEQNAAMLQQQIAAIEAQKRKVEDYANRGVFGRFFHDVGSVTEACAEEGLKDSGPLGGLLYGAVGLGVSPLVATKRALVGK